jgi:hypothetical protein
LIPNRALLHCCVVLQVLYRAAKQRFDEEDDFKTRAREAVTELQGGRPEYLQVGVGVGG